ncbi:hypothetical protein [Mycolicibacterium komossense]|uniref:Uncharacterized protein n=1 Tax=Mycolicibacterium komossense TaxID=1779 RepID=A0ABT3C5S5_9MYCO|nr:hypothetical protein [Mycolicibacterium komossense]
MSGLPQSSRPPAFPGPHNVRLDLFREQRANIVDWDNSSQEVGRGAERWDLERQARLVAGSIVPSSVPGSIAVRKLKWLGSPVGGGLTFAAVSNTCAVGAALSKLPYNRSGAVDGPAAVSQLGQPHTWA